MTDPQTDPSPDSEPAASDAYGHDDALIGDFTSPDVDLSHLIPTSDGEPDDDEDPTPAETVEQAPTGQALIEDGQRLASERDDLIAAGNDPADLAIPIHPADVQEPTA